MSEEDNVVSRDAAKVLDLIRAHRLEPPLEVVLAQCDELLEAFPALVETLKAREPVRGPFNV